MWENEKLIQKLNFEKGFFLHFLKLPEVTRSYPKLPEITQSYPKLPEVTRSYPKLPEITRSYPKLLITWDKIQQ